MKADRMVNGRQVAIGVLAVGALAFGLSMAGAAVPMPSKSATGSQQDKHSMDKPVIPTLRDDCSVKARGVDGRVSVSTTRPPREFAGAPISQEISKDVRLGKVGEIPVLPVEIVNPYDDEMTLARQKGIELDRRTGLPVGQGGVANVQTGCSFDIDCDDCNPCTSDFCDISPGQPLGSGTCVNTGLPDGSDGGCSDGLCCNGRETCHGGVCELPGHGTGVFDPTQGCEFNICTGNEVCDEFDGKCKPPCTGGGTCAVSGGACTTSLQCDQSIHGNYCLNCNDGLVCNGTETCDVGTGLCTRGTNPCGDASATCGEKRCSTQVGNPPFCSSDSDCVAGGLCSVNGPICFPGRCCSGSGFPTCSRRAKSITYRGIQSCDSVSGTWYPGDLCDFNTNICTEGDLIYPDTGSACPSGASSASSVKCPAYGAGIAPRTNFATDVALVVGPFSRSLSCDHFDIGDDYTFSNNSYMAIDHLRWIGAGGGRLVWEFRDASGNLIEDAVTQSIVTSLAVRTLVLNPPIVVPPSGYVVVRPDPLTAPNGRTYVVATDAVDVGFNDPNLLWYDGAIHNSSTFIKECVGGSNSGGWCDPVNAGTGCPFGTCTARNQTLAVELEGAATSLPVGACCNRTTGTCNGNVQWLCEGSGGNFLGVGSFCNSCSVGTTNGSNCSRCVGGLNPNEPCQFSFDCQGGTCAANASTCANRCTGGAANGAPCLPATAATDCPGGTCTVGGNPGSVCNANSSCVTGACCNSTSGACTMTTLAACTGIGTFQGFGSDCDADEGHDNGQQSCCHQPMVTGGDNCQDAVVQPINVTGTTNTDPAVLTVSGDNSGATGQDTCGDAIFDITSGPGADPGWWEAFQIDGCAFVRVDFCCSEPTVEPQWNFLYTGCPCNSVVPNVVDPNAADESSVSRGAPYCGDDNLWVKFGPLPAGTYYIPVYSVLAGHHGPYQMHVTAYACPTAACCTGANCSQTDILNCQDTLQGTYLGPPNLPTAVPICDDTPVTGTCGTGSCCTAPGQCKDQIPDNGPKATESTCLNLNPPGDFHGGIRCKGGTCSNDANKSCSSDGDCPGGGCVGNTTQLAQKSPCPACDIEDNSHCQRTADPPLNARLSDYCVGDCISQPTNEGEFVADDFVANVSGALTSVCFSGVFLDQDAGLADCSSTNPPEDFEIAIYGDGFGLPNSNNFIGRTSTTVIARSRRGTALGADYYQWQVALNQPIHVVASSTYWISIINNTNKNFGGSAGCDWFWIEADQSEGNHYFAEGEDQLWTEADVRSGSDMGFCLNIESSVPSVPVRACCSCTTFSSPSGSDPHCQDLTAEECASVHGDWLFNVNTCGNTVCQAPGFAGDNCFAAFTATGNNYSDPFNNFCANTDGPANLECEGVGARFGADIWYQYTASCTGTLTIETCDDTGGFDTVLAIYHNNATPTTCVCPPANNQFQFGDCNDDGCTFAGAGSKITPFPVVQGECYTVRVAGSRSAQGHGTLHVTCGTNAPPDVQHVPGLPDMNRYLGFTIPPSGGSTAIQVSLDYLMHPNPPNLSQFPPPCCDDLERGPGCVEGPNGCVRWVGEVRFAECIGGGNAGQPCTGSQDCPGGTCSGSRCAGGANVGLACTSAANCPGSSCLPSACTGSQVPPTYFMCAPLVCSPHYENFAAHTGNRPLFVYGAEIMPSSTYTVTQVASQCSSGVEFKTQRWCDVVAAFQSRCTCSLGGNECLSGDPCNGNINCPSGTCNCPLPMQPNITDCGAIVDCFRGVSGASIVPVCDVAPQVPNNSVNITDVAACVDAFRGFPYPYPCASVCTPSAMCP